MTPRILFVCTANVCRSPLMAYSFFDAVDPIHDWTVTSRGIAAENGRSMCNVAAEVFSQREKTTVDIDTHRSMRIAVRDVEVADIIVTASKQERSAVARLDPASRSRTFTLREALALAASGPDGVIGKVSDLEEFAERLHVRRGAVELAPTRTRGWGGRSAGAVDITDVHQRRLFTHRRVLRTTNAAAAEFARIASASLAPAEPAIG